MGGKSSILGTEARAEAEGEEGKEIVRPTGRGTGALSQTWNKD